MDILDFWFAIGLLVCLIIAVAVFCFLVASWQMIYHEMVKNNPLYLNPS